jgi:D-psicose/D-tagatose/L-ribulose 3-epimerase
LVIMRKPLIGANLWIWNSPVTTEVIRGRAPRVAAMGFDAIELPLEASGDWTAREVRSVLEDTGLRPGVCAAMAPGRDLTTEDASTVRATQEYLRACIEAAAGIGATVVAGPIYSKSVLA